MLLNHTQLQQVNNVIIMSKVKNNNVNARVIQLLNDTNSGAIFVSYQP